MVNTVAATASPSVGVYINSPSILDGGAASSSSTSTLDGGAASSSFADTLDGGPAGPSGKGAVPTIFKPSLASVIGQVNTNNSLKRFRYDDVDVVSQVDTVATAKRISQLAILANVESSVDTSLLPTRFRYDDVDVVSQVDVTAVGRRIRQILASIESLVDVATKIKRIRETSASVMTSANMLADFIRQISILTNAESSVDTSLIPARFRYDDGIVDVSADIVAEDTRLRYDNLDASIDVSEAVALSVISSALMDTAVSVDVSETAIPSIILNLFADTNIDIDVSAIRSNYLKASADIKADIGSQRLDGGWASYTGPSISGGDATTTASTIYDGGDAYSRYSMAIPKAIHSGETNTGIAVDILAFLTKLAQPLQASPEIGINVESLASIIAGWQLATEIKLDLDINGIKQGVLITFEGTLASGEEMTINTEQLTIVDANGNNLRGLTDIVEWMKINPNSTLTLEYGDTAASRNVEIKVKDKDRYI